MYANVCVYFYNAFHSCAYRQMNGMRCLYACTSTGEERVHAHPRMPLRVLCTVCAHVRTFVCLVCVCVYVFEPCLCAYARSPVSDIYTLFF